MGTICAGTRGVAVYHLAPMHSVTVSLGSRSYPIHVGAGLIGRLGEYCAPLRLGANCAVISDSNVAPLYAKPVLASLKTAGFEPLLFSVPAGEKSKSLEQLESIYDRLAEKRLERASFIVALGGGVVGDLAGFVAATYLRGIHFVQVPTSLLAQVDSSVGGKVGINLKSGKNLVGAFHQPRLVLCDLATLDSLPEREFRSGLAEVIKYGIIRDAALFATLERELPKVLERDRDMLAQIVARCCEIKAEVVAQDETEGGLRAILNFGHTVGHAIEAICGYGKYLHGEAISIGQAAAARLSVERAGLPPQEAEQIENLLAQAGLPTAIKLSASQGLRLLEAMRLDKKVRGGEITFVLARRIGQVQPGFKASREEMQAVLAALGA